MVSLLQSLQKQQADGRSEATSALDGESEAHVQQALDNASKGRLVTTPSQLVLLADETD